MNALYRLTFDYGDPRFAQLSFAENSPSLLGNSHLFQDFEPPNPGKLNWQAPRLSEAWTTAEVVGDLPAFCDYTVVDGIPFLSSRAVAALRDLLEPSGELLPCVTSVGEYSAFNVLAISDAFDRDRSDAMFAEAGGKETAYSVDRFEFHKQRLGQHAIFRIREYPPAYVVDERFVHRVERAGLNGFYFIKIWPFASDESWEEIELQRKRKRKKEGAIGKLRGQSIEIRMPVTASPTEHDECTEADCEQAAAIVDDMTGLLVGQKANDEDFIGAVDQIETGPNGIIVSIICADSERAFKAIEPALRKAAWRFPIRVEVYPGNPLDRTVAATMIEIS